MGRVTGISLVLLLVMSMALIGVGPVSALAVVRVDPTQSYKAAGGTFSVTVKVDNVVDIYGFTVKLKYNNKGMVLNHTTITPGDVVAGRAYFPLDTSKYNQYVEFTITFTDPPPGKTGSFTLVQIGFIVLVAGQSDLDLGAANVDTKLGDSTATPIPFTPQDGDFHSPITISVFPSSVGYPGIVPVTFTVDLMIANAYNVHSIEMKLGYDTSVLDATDAKEGPFLSSFGATTFTKTINDPGGYAMVNVTLAAGLEGSGSGKVANVTFYGNVKPAVSALTIYDAKIAEKNGAPIKPAAITLVPGQYLNVVPKATLAALPATIKNPALTPGKFFSIDINITDALDLFGFEFKLGYETLLLDVDKVEEGEFLKKGTSPPGSGTFVGKNETREDLGRVWLAITRYGVSSGVTGSGRLAKITFKVTGTGKTPLDLYDTKLGTSTGESLPHDTYDSFFDNVPTLLVDVYTQKTAGALFLPGEDIIISALVTWMGVGQSGVTVAISVRDPTGTVVLDRAPVTDINGKIQLAPFKLSQYKPFGTYTVYATAELMGYKGTDTVTFAFNWKMVITSKTGAATVARGSLWTFTIKVKNNDNVNVFAVVTETEFDSWGQLLGRWSFSGLFVPGTTTLTGSIMIPTWAQLGEGTGYAGVYNNYPHLGGTAYSPEVTINFMIV